ncbi:mpv17-like protein isoform X3 [Lethenteron reissneri]|uniref:mpv17-like protein isoform X3 n=1 Tax=Lethenteron reissneri TaxID=7753 RepID=UPI002AB6E2C0|nr:mpv17-like protein isoform X3 [Lethenteron reissneri]
MNTIATWVRRHSWLSSVAAFGILFAGADAVQQRFLGPPPPPSHHQRPPHHPDGARTARAALLGLAFHGNFNYVWLRGLERAIPGSAARAVVVKVLADQTVAGPITISAFFTGMSLLEGKPDIFKDLRQKFWPTYKTGVVYWSAMQLYSQRLRTQRLRTQQLYISTAALTYAPSDPLTHLFWAGGSANIRPSTA